MIIQEMGKQLIRQFSRSAFTSLHVTARSWVEVARSSAPSTLELRDEDLPSEEEEKEDLMTKTNLTDVEILDEQEALLHQPKGHVSNVIGKSGSSLVHSNITRTEAQKIKRDKAVKSKRRAAQKSKAAVTAKGLREADQKVEGEMQAAREIKREALEMKKEAAEEAGPKPNPDHSHSKPEKDKEPDWITTVPEGFRIGIHRAMWDKSEGLWITATDTMAWGLYKGVRLCCPIVETNTKAADVYGPYVLVGEDVIAETWAPPSLARAVVQVACGIIRADPLEDITSSHFSNKIIYHLTRNGFKIPFHVDKFIYDTITRGIDQIENARQNSLDIAFKEAANVKLAMSRVRDQELDDKYSGPHAHIVPFTASMIGLSAYLYTKNPWALALSAMAWAYNPVCKFLDRMAFERLSADYDHFTKKFKTAKYAPAKTQNVQKASLARSVVDVSTLGFGPGDVHRTYKRMYDEVDQYGEPLVASTTHMTIDPTHTVKRQAPVTTYGSIIPRAPMVVPDTKHPDNVKACIHKRIANPAGYSKAEARRFVKWAKSFLNDLKKQKPFDDLMNIRPLEEVLVGKPYSAQRKKDMLKMAKDFLTTPDWRQQLMLKDEAYMGKDPSDFKTRAVLARTDKIVAVLLPYLECISTIIAERLFPKDSDQVYDKDCTPLERGALAQRFADVDGTVWEVDCSNWDGSLTKEQLDFEWWLLTEYFYGQPVMETALGKIFGKKNTELVGIRVMYYHARTSGDLWTSSFNSLLNILKALYIFGRRSKVVAAGDDGFFVPENVPAGGVQAAIEQYRVCGGFTAKIFTKTIDTLEYCSGRFYPLAGDVRMWGIKPFRALAKFGLNLGKVRPRQELSTKLGTAISLRPIALHVPVLSEAIQTVENQLGRKGACIKPNFSEQSWNAETYKYAPELPYSWHTEKWFCDTYDITHADLESMKASMARIDWSQPVALTDPLFEKCFNVDCGCETGQKSYWDITSDQNDVAARPSILTRVAKTLYNTIPFLHVVLPAWGLAAHEFSVNDSIACALVEEAWTLAMGPLYTIDSIIKESNSWPRLVDRVIRHGTLQCLRWVHPIVGAAAHVAHNYYCHTQNDPCARSKVKTPAPAVKPKGNYIERRKAMSAGSSKPFLEPRPEQKSAGGGEDMPLTCLRNCLNPFSPTCEGQKLPDLVGRPSSAFTARGARQPSTTVEGLQLLAFYPSLFGHEVRPSWTGTTPSWSTTITYTVANYASLTAAFGSFRTVCGGVRVQCQASLMNVTGTLHVCHVPWSLAETVAATGDLPTSVDQMRNMPHYLSVSLASLVNDPLIVPFKRIDTNSEFYTGMSFPTNTANGAATSAGWSIIVMYITGAAASSSPVYINSILQCEGVVLPRNSVLTSTPAAPHMPQVMDALYRLADASPSAMLESQYEGYLRRIWNSAKKFYQRNKEVIDLGTTIVGALLA